MPYQICISKTSACCVIPWTVSCNLVGTPCIRSIEVFGCSRDLTLGEKSNNCCQGTTQPTGTCCAWTVPSGVTSVIVDLWGAGGGGGSGAAAECCGNNPGGGGGTYVRRQFTVAAGDILTLCAGAGGCFGGGIEGTSGSSWCCCGTQGSCSFVLRNGNFCVDSWGGRQGGSNCSGHCYSSCGNCGGTWCCITGACGSNYGCTGYTIDMIAPGNGGMTQPCTGYCSDQTSWGGGTSFGSDDAYWAWSCLCWGYWKFNNSCTNSSGIAGPGGDGINPSSTSSAFNTPSSTNYTYVTTQWACCIRSHAAPPGNFPGGGGASGWATGCCMAETSGGPGASGYVRVWY